MQIIAAFFVSLVVACTTAFPLQNQAYPVKETPLENFGNGGYQFGYQTSDQNRFEVAQVVTVRNARTGELNNILRVQGYYGFVDYTGRYQQLVEYTADENGYHPKVTFRLL